MVANLTSTSAYFCLMKHSIWFIFFVILACNASNTSTTPVIQGKKVLPEFAKGFEIVENSHGFDIILHDLQNIGDTLEVLHFDSSKVNNVACLSTTHLSFLDKIDALEKCKAVAFADLVRNQNAQTLIQTNAMINLSAGDDVAIEKLLAVQPEYFFVYPYGHGNYDKYTSKGIACIPVSEYLETHPLGRLEWIKVFGYILGKKEKAFAVFEEIKAQYLLIAEKTKQINVENTPCVFTGSEEGGVWYAPPGNSFQAQLIRDAGGNYILADSISNGNIQLPFEKLLFIAATCDYWGKVEYSTSPITVSEIIQKDSRYAQLKAIKQNQIFVCNTNETDYFGDAVVEPHILLMDLFNVFQGPPSEGYQAKYFKALSRANSDN